MEPPGFSAKRRRSEKLRASKTGTIARPIVNRQEPPPPDAGHEEVEGDGIDRISGLPDAILGDIISLLSTKEAARTKILASQWRNIWRNAPLVLDATDLAIKSLSFNHAVCAAADEALASKISHIISTHRGPGRHFCISPHNLHDRAATVDAWLSSPALNNLQELDFWDNGIYGCLRLFAPAPLPASTFRFSATLRVATFARCKLLYSSVARLHFPHLKLLGLQFVRISEGSLHTMISSCPALECLLLESSFGFSRVKISSSSIRSISVGANHSIYSINMPELQEFIIVDAPCLERLLFLQQGMAVRVSVMAAPKLETIGSLSDGLHTFRVMFGTTTIEGLQVVNLMTVVCNVKILAVKSWHVNLDMVIDLMKCFPCLEKLYIKGCISGKMNRWHRKHRQFIKCSDISLKTIVLEDYRGTRSQVNFASFFLLNASKLELLMLKVEDRGDNEAFFEKQYGLLQMEKRASRIAQLHLSTKKCRRGVHANHVRDLAITDPFECRC